MFQYLFGKDYARRRALRRARPGPLRDFLSQPLVKRRTECRHTSVLALDLETTGLDPDKDDILSMGMVEISGNSIHLNSSWYRVVRAQRQVPEESAVIHGIMDDESAAGAPLDEVLPELLQRLAGKVMLVHFARIEQGFIDAACRRLYGAPFVVRTVDTLELAQRVFERRNHTIQSGDLRLFNLRPRYNLPRYRAHNALSDALATAELYLAMQADMAPDGHGRIGQFLT